MLYIHNVCIHKKRLSVSGHSRIRGGVVTVRKVRVSCSSPNCVTGERTTSYTDRMAWHDTERHTTPSSRTTSQRSTSPDRAHLFHQLRSFHLPVILAFVSGVGVRNLLLPRNAAIKLTKIGIEKHKVYLLSRVYVHCSVIERVPLLCTITLRAKNHKDHFVARKFNRSRATPPLISV